MQLLPSFRVLLFAAIFVFIIGAVWFWFIPNQTNDHAEEPLAKPPASLPKVGQPAPKPEFVGRAACTGCHAEQDRLWQGSHHDLAMQEANETSILGNFNDAEFEKDGVVSRFYRRDGHYWVRTDGPNGRLADFEVKYTFGYSPLQQYLLELPGGRLQALSIAWDSRPKEQGGQRWFHLYPNEHITHTDELHWTKLSQNWNYMCAECHSTNLQKNYDQSSRSYRTTWSEINVACEACHGPGSRHIAWANAKNVGSASTSLGGLAPVQQDSATKGLALLLDERKGIHWDIDPISGNAVRNPPRNTDKEIQTCARCHARRAQLLPDYQYGQPLMDTHLPSLLQQTLYHADGQIDGEVYEYGSLLQSKMVHAGVTCTDCHQPHSLKLRLPGNGVCLQCHSAEKYATEKHHFHPIDSTGANCVDCHMPVKNYMVVDPRRDHSFRIPRPDLSLKLGTPNACNSCHADKSTRWAMGKVRQWVGREPKGYQNYAETLHAIRTQTADAETRLLGFLDENAQPAIAKATAVSGLEQHLTQESLPFLAEALDNAEPLVRAAAVEALEPLPLQQRWALAHGLLRDPVRVVRVLVAGVLAGVPADQVPKEEQADFQKATDDFLASQRFNADEPGAQVNLGNFYAVRGEHGKAEAAYREALALNSDWMPAYANLADLYRQTGRDAEGEILLREGLAIQPKSAALYHSLGLLQVRQKNMASALSSLKRAVELAPNDARFAYVYAVALASTGHPREARAVVDAGLKHVPESTALGQLRSQWTAK